MPSPSVFPLFFSVFRSHFPFFLRLSHPHFLFLYFCSFVALTLTFLFSLSVSSLFFSLFFVYRHLSASLSLSHTFTLYLSFSPISFREETGVADIDSYCPVRRVTLLACVHIFFPLTSLLNVKTNKRTKKKKKQKYY